MSRTGRGRIKEVKRPRARVKAYDQHEYDGSDPDSLDVSVGD
jgi:hypothetical protein